MSMAVILLIKQHYPFLLSTAVGKYDSRPLNHTVHEFSLSAPARRIVLAESDFVRTEAYNHGQYDQISSFVRVLACFYG